MVKEDKKRALFLFILSIILVGFFSSITLSIPNAKAYYSKSQWYYNYTDVIQSTATVMNGGGCDECNGYMVDCSSLGPGFKEWKKGCDTWTQDIFDSVAGCYKICINESPSNGAIDYELKKYNTGCFLDGGKSSQELIDICNNNALCSEGYNLINNKEFRDYCSLMSYIPSYGLGGYWNNGCFFVPWVDFAVRRLCAKLTCRAGYYDCDNNISTGCEINLMNNVSNCGSCGNDCRQQGKESCEYGQCKGEIPNNCESTYQGKWRTPTADHALCTGTWKSYSMCVADTDNNGKYDKQCCPIWNMAYLKITQLDVANIADSLAPSYTCPTIK